MRPVRLCSIVPPYLLRAIAANGDGDDRALALAALAMSSGPRRERAALLQLAGELVLPPRVKRRTVYDAGQRRAVPGHIVRTEGARRTRDASVNEAYDAAGKTYDYFRRVHGRRSVDDHGLGIRSTVHYGERFNNAHWNGRQMIYGDGDGKYFRRFTSSLDVVAHELTHGVTQYSAALGFSGQCGALAEHFSDVFGILVKQYWLKQLVAQSDWMIGSELLTSRVNGAGIRSMKKPGSAYDDEILGKDPQPSHMRDYVKTYSDDRGVHINCGIPNRAFYRVAMLLGGYAWETVGPIWYRVLTRELGPRARFQQCADATWRVAGELYGHGSEPQDAVQTAWREVGIEVAAIAAPRLRIRKSVRESFDWPVAAAEVPYLG
jgi:Zn-dependent metalloprotease